MPGDAGHIPVLLQETLDLLGIRPGMRIMDCTLGLGGHSLAMLEKTGGDVEILGLDRDPQAQEIARERLSAFPGKARLALTRFSDFPLALEEAGWDGVDAALVDAGASSLHFDDAERGFSFLADGPLDMRMGQWEGEAPAWNLINKASFDSLRRIIRERGGSTGGANRPGHRQGPGGEAHRRDPGTGGRCGSGLSGQMAGDGPAASGHQNVPGPAHGREQGA